MSFHVGRYIVHVEYVCDDLHDMDCEIMPDWMERLDIFAKSGGPGVACLYGVGRIQFRGSFKRLAVEEYVGVCVPLTVYLAKQSEENVHERQMWAIEQLLDTMNRVFWQKNIAHLDLHTGNIVVVTDATGNDLLYVLDGLGTPLGVLGPVHEDYGYEEKRFKFSTSGTICLKAHDTTAVDVYTMGLILMEIVSPTMDEKLTLFCSELRVTSPEHQLSGVEFIGAMVGLEFRGGVRKFMAGEDGGQVKLGDKIFPLFSSIMDFLSTKSLVQVSCTCKMASKKIVSVTRELKDPMSVGDICQLLIGTSLSTLALGVSQIVIHRLNIFELREKPVFYVWQDSKNQQIQHIQDLLKKSRVYARIVFREIVFHRHVPYLRSRYRRRIGVGRIVPHRDRPGRTHQSLSLSVDFTFQNGDLGCDYIKECDHRPLSR